VPIPTLPFVSIRKYSFTPIPFVIVNDVVPYPPTNHLLVPAFNKLIP
jgi:hypothetical protein